LNIPHPSPDQALYKQVLEEGFQRFPERRANYLKYQAAKRGVSLDYLPIKLDIENVSRCNFHCTMCQVSDWPGLKRADDMSFEDYKALIDAQDGLIEIKLQGMGEPLMGSCYFDMISYARAKYIWVRSTTNGSLLHLQDNYKRLIDSDICELQISIDGTTPETYEKIRRGGNFKKTADNCILINQYCRDVQRKRTRMWSVIQRDNFHELEAFPRFAQELGFERLTLSLDLNDWGQEQWKKLNDFLDVREAFRSDQIQALIDLGKQHQVEVTFWFIDKKYDTDNPSHLCPWPFERAYVSSDMRVVPCCLIANPEVTDLGDARDFSKVWNGDDMITFRKMHLQGQIPKICQSCYKNRPSQSQQK